MSKISYRKITYVVFSLFFSGALSFFFSERASLNFRYLEALIVIFSIIMGAVFIGLTIALSSNAPTSKKSSYKFLKSIEVNKAIALFKLNTIASFSFLFISVFYMLFFGKNETLLEVEKTFIKLESLLISTIVFISTLSLFLTFMLSNAIFHLININKDEAVED